jgi:hypothetical protein
MLGLLSGPLAAMRGALDTVDYARAFVARGDRTDAGLSADDDERGLIVAEELGASPAKVLPEQSADVHAA